MRTSGLVNRVNPDKGSRTRATTAASSRASAPAGSRSSPADGRTSKAVSPVRADSRAGSQDSRINRTISVSATSATSREIRAKVDGEKTGIRAKAQPLFA